MGGGKNASYQASTGGNAVTIHGSYDIYQWTENGMLSTDGLNH